MREAAREREAIPRTGRVDAMMMTRTDRVDAMMMTRNDDRRWKMNSKDEKEEEEEEEEKDGAKEAADNQFDDSE